MLKPLTDLVIIKPIEVQVGSIIIKNDDADVCRGIVIKTGDKVNDCKVGDEVLYNKNNIMSYLEEEVRHYVTREEEIIAILN